MGLRGPAPTPTALRVLRGNPGKRPLPEDEPKPRESRPYCPEHIRADAVAHREWKRLEPILRRMRVLTEADYIALANLCQTYSMMLAAQKTIADLNEKQAGIGGLVILVGKKKSVRKQRDGSEVVTESPGFMQISPLLTIVSNAIGTITKLCREFGLTPAARSTVKAAPGPVPANPWANL